MAISDMFGGFFKPKKIPDSKDTRIVKDRDGAVHHDEYIGAAGAGHSLYTLDWTSELTGDANWISEYRKISELPEVSSAIEDISQEAIVVGQNDEIAQLNLDDTDFSDKIKKLIVETYKYLLVKTEFNNKAEDIFKSFYVDGRLYLQKIVNKGNLEDGIIGISILDSTRTKKVVVDKIEKETGKILASEKFFLFNPNEDVDSKGFANYNTNKEIIKFAPESITYINSGIIDHKTKMVKSYLHKAVKPANQLSLLEDSLVIYRLARSSEKRIFYIDVGNLPKSKAEQYITNIMNKFKNKMVFDSATGKVKDNKNHLAIAEDIYLPRQGGSKGTEVSTLPAAANLGETEDIEYFKKKLYKSLHIPLSRLEAEASFNIGRASEITRDELKFSKFIRKAQTKFGALILDLLVTELVLKKIITKEDFEKNRGLIKILFNTDSFFEELKQAEILENRFSLLSNSESFAGKYVSVNYLQKNVLMLNDDEIDEIEKQQAEDKNKYKDDEDGF